MRDFTEPISIGVDRYDLVIRRAYKMLCASAITEERTYRKVPDKDGRVWLYAIDVPNPGGFVYMHDPRDMRSKGFGGRELDFIIEGAGVYKAKGRRYEGKYHGRCIIEDVVYQDTEPQLGRYDRYKELASKHPEATYYYMESAGGSSCGPLKR